MSEESFEIAVFAKGDPKTKRDVLPRRTSPQFLDETKDVGGGKLTIYTQDKKLTDTPDLLEYRSVVKALRNGRAEGAFVVQGKDDTIISADEDAGKQVEISGEGLKTWFHDAVLYPADGLKAQSSEQRVFSWASPKGAWYKAADWKTPVKCWKWELLPSGPPAAGYSPYRYVPANWPDAPNAWWIWSVKTAWGETAPPGYNYFRYEFDTTVAGNYSVFAAGDNTLEVFVDAAQVIEAVDTTLAYTSTYRADFELNPGHHVLAIRVKNTTYQAGLLAALFRAGEAGAGIPAELIATTGDAGWVVNPYPATEPGWTIGEMVLTLLNEADKRDVQFPNWITPAFTATTDSSGQPWDTFLPWSFDIGAEYYDIIEALEEFACDVWIDPEDYKLYIWNQRGKDRSVQTTAGQPIIFREGLNLTRANEQGKAEIKNHLLLNTDDGWIETTPETSASEDTYGRVEGKLSTKASMDVSKELAKKTFEQKQNADEGATYTIVPIPGAVPNKDFFVGDWVLAPNKSNELVKRRVVSIALTEDNASGAPVYAVEFDSIFQTREDRIERWLKQVSQGGLASGSAMGGSSGSTGGSTTSPVGAPNGVLPQAPTNVSVSSVGKWNAGGGAFSEVTLSWDRVTMNVDGSPNAGIAYYEVMGKPSSEPGTALRSLATVTGSSLAATVSGISAGITWDFSVRAATSSLRISANSPVVKHTTVLPAQDVGTPDNPTLSTSLGTVSIVWNGLVDSGETPPSFFNFVVAEYSTAETGTYKPIGTTTNAAGTIVATGLDVGELYWFRLVAVDLLGRESDPSGSVSITVEGFDADELAGEIRDEIDQAKADAATALGRADKAVTDAASANTKAGAAQTAADKAAADALAASGLAAGKGKVIFQPTAPTGDNANANNLWVNTTNGANTPNRWDGSKWVVATDKAATDAATAAAAAKTAADKAAADAAAAATAAGLAQTSADSKNRIWYQTTAPAGTGHKVGDTWFNTADGNKISRWDGSNWTANLLGSSSIGPGAVAAGNIAQTVNDKIAQGISDAATANTNAGTAKAQADKALQDAATAQGAASTAKSAADAAAADAATAAGIANGKGKVIFQNTAPTGENANVNNLWVNTTNGANTPNRYNGTTWVASTDKAAIDAANAAAAADTKAVNAASAAAQAATDAAAAQTTANSKSRNWPTSTTAPTTGMVANDTWIRSTDGALFRYSGSAWVAVPLATQSYVQSRGLNLVTNGSGLLGDNTNFEGLTFDSSDHPVGAASMFTGSNQTSTFTTENIPVDPALTYEMSATVKQLEGTANFYFAIAPIDADGSAINPQMYTYLPGSFTTLAQPLAPGDTTITLTSSANWHTGSTASQKYAAIGNYTDGKGYTWPVGTYTRTFPQFSSISGNVVTLAAPYTSRPAPAGTPVWNSFAAGTYLYPVTNVPAPAEWTTFSGRFAGITTPGASSVNSLPRPTAFVKLGFLINYPPRTGAPRQGFANISLNEITVAAAAQQAANVAQTTANGKNTVTYGTAAPTVVGTRAGDIFFVRVAATGVITAQYEWTGTAWQIRTLDNATIANLDAGKLTAGTVSADRIGANSITASKLTLGDFSNLLDDPTFTNPLGRSWIISSGPVSLATSTSAPGRVIVLAANSGTVRVDNGNQISVTPGSSYYMAFRAVNSTGAQAAAILTGRNEAGTGVWSQAIGIPANSGWSDYTFTTAAAPDTVAYMTFSASITAASTSGSFQFAKPSVRRRNGGELIVDGGITAQQIAAGTITAGQIKAGAITSTEIATGTITAQSGIIASLDAGVITSGFISSSRIQALSITTDKLLVGSTVNVFTGGDFEGTAPFTNVPSARVDIDTTFSHSGTKSLRIVQSTSSVVLGATGSYPVAEGDKINFGYWGYAPAQYLASSNNRFEIRDQAGNLLRDYTFGAGILTPGEWTQVGPTFPYVVPAGVTSVAINVNVEGNTSSGTVWLDDVTLVVSKKGALVVDGTLLVDGTISSTKLVSNSITADQIKANSITAGEIKAGAITANEIATGTITATQLSANSITTEKLAADAITAKHTITGAQIQTSATGARTEMTSQGLRTIDAAGNELVKLGYGISTGMSLRDPRTGSLVPMAAFSFGVAAAGRAFVQGLPFPPGGTNNVFGAYVNEYLSTYVNSPTGKVMCFCNARVNNATTQQNYIVEFIADLRVNRTDPNAYVRVVQVSNVGMTPVSDFAVVDVTPNVNYELFLAFRCAYTFGGSGAPQAGVSNRTFIAMPI